MEPAESAAEGAVGGDSAEGAAGGACAGEVLWGGQSEEDLRQGVVWDLRQQQFPFHIDGHREVDLSSVFCCSDDFFCSTRKM